MKNLEAKIQKAIHEKGWNINYHNGHAKNVFGTEYTVSIEGADSYFDLDSVSLGSKEITIKEPCDYYRDTMDIGNDQEFMGYALAHELGHTETYGITSILAGAIMIKGVVKAVKKSSRRPLVASLALATACQVLGGELLAESAAYCIHNVDLGTSTSIPSPAEVFKMLLDYL